MAFCPNCGKALPDGVTCDCQGTDNSGITPVTAEKNNNSKKGFLVMGVALVAVVVIIVTLISSTFGGGYKKPVNELVTSLNKCDSAKMISAIVPKKKLKELKKDMKDSKYDWSDLTDTMDEGLEEMLEGLEDEYGKNVKFSVKFVDKKKVKGDTLDEIEEEYEDDFDAEISKAYKVKVKMQIKGKDDEDSNSSWIYVVKVKGDDWKISPYDDESGLTDLLSYSLF